MFTEYPGVSHRATALPFKLTIFYPQFDIVVIYSGDLGQRHESTQFQIVLEGISVPQPVGRPRKRPERLAGDKAYSFPGVREWLRAHGIEAIIPVHSIKENRGIHLISRVIRDDVLLNNALDG